MDKLMFEKKAFYSTSDVAEILEVHPTTVREWISEGKLYGIKLSERVTRIPLGGLLEFLGEPLPVTEGVLSPDEADRHWKEAAAERPASVRHA